MCLESSGENNFEESFRRTFEVSLVRIRDMARHETPKTPLLSFEDWVAKLSFGQFYISFYFYTIYTHSSTVDIS